MAKKKKKAARRRNLNPEEIADQFPTGQLVEVTAVRLDENGMVTGVVMEEGQIEQMLNPRKRRR